MLALKVVLIFRNILLWKFPWNGQLLNVPVIYHCAKNQKKLMNYSWEKCWTHGERGRGRGRGREREGERGRETDKERERENCSSGFLYTKNQNCSFNYKNVINQKLCIFNWHRGNVLPNLWFDNSHKHTYVYRACTGYTEHTQGLIDWHIHKIIYQHQFLYVNRSLVMATCYVLLWINDSMISKMYLVQQVINDFVFQKLSTCKTHICRLY